MRAFLLSGSGRLIKKKKTTARPSGASPIFDETVVFDLPFAQLEVVTVLVCVFHRPPEQNNCTDHTGAALPWRLG